LFSTPVVAATAAFGAIPAAVGFLLFYGIGGFIVSLLVARVYDSRLAGEPGRLERWMERETAHRRSRWARRLVASGSWLSFAAASVVLGPIVTTWLVRSLGRRQSMALVAVASTAIWVVSFVGTYTGLTSLVLM
jgi:hypothetical protein